MTFHVRLVSTPGRTDGVVAGLACDPGGHGSAVAAG